MKIVEVKRKKERIKCIRFLKEGNSLNLYLYDRITQGSVFYRSFYFKSNDRVLGLIHTKSGLHIHLYFSKIIEAPALKEIKDFLFNKFPDVSTLFGDKDCIERFLNVCNIAPRLRREFTFMEVERAYFKPDFSFKCAVPAPEMADILLPLQISYELEELGVVRKDIHSSRVLAVLKKRLHRRDITALFDGGDLVAFAGVNARFENNCQIGTVYVLPEHRGKGFGYSVVSSHLDRLFNKYNRIVLFVNRNNKGALHLYKNVGFRPVGELEQVFMR
ncbi:MAG: GNAT family N-acetyltransferase [Spirochaetes bacterium]|nr:GNAT family N-acetyltransferase [Spirochaetota bacterium]